MTIDSRVPEITHDQLQSSQTGNTEIRQRSVTSVPTESSARKTSAAADKVSGKMSNNGPMNLSEPIDVKGAVEKLNKLVQSQRTNVSFSVDEDAHATVIKIFKTETGELIKQFPPEEILAMKAKINKTVGWLYDSKA